MVAGAIEIKRVKGSREEGLLAYLAAKKSGVEVFGCYQCLKCSSGCPMNFAMDILPHQIVRMVQLGLEKEVLTSKTIWICASCYTCSTRCPNDIDIAYLMDALRRMALTNKASLGEKDISTFHSAFLSSIKELGRVHEVGMVRQYKIRSGGIFKDIPAMLKEAKLGWKMFKRGKLRLSPSRIKKVEEIKEIFYKSNL